MYHPPTAEAPKKATRAETPAEPAANSEDDLPRGGDGAEWIALEARPWLSTTCTQREVVAHMKCMCVSSQTDLYEGALAVLRKWPS